MSSTFQGLYIARSGVRAARTALNITGQNISNSGTAGYTRQRVNQAAIPSAGIDAMYPYTAGTNTGQGVDVINVAQLRDTFLDAQYRTQYAKCGGTSTTLSALQDIESSLNETTTDGLNAAFSSLLQQLEGITSTGKSTSTEADVKNAALALASKFNNCAGQIDTIWKQQFSDITQDGTDQVNSLVKSIAGLSDQIRDADLSGTPALELLDERNSDLDELSQYVSIKAIETPTDVGSGKKVDVLSVVLADKDGNALTDGNGDPSYTLVDGTQYAKMSVNNISHPYDPVNVQLSGLTKNGIDFNISSGKIATDADGKLTGAPTSSTYTFQRGGISSPRITLNCTSGESLSSVAADLQGQLDTTYSGAVKVGVSSDGKHLTFQTTCGDSLSISHATAPSDGPDNLLGITDAPSKESSTDTVMLNSSLQTGTLQGYLKLLNENGEYDTAAGSTTTTYRGIGYYRKLLNTIASNFASVMNEQNSTNDATVPYNSPLFTDASGGTADIDAANIRIAAKWTSGYLTNSKDPNHPSDNSNIAAMVTALNTADYTLKTPNDINLYTGTIQESVSNIGLTVGGEIKNGVGSDDTTNQNMLDNIDSRRQQISSVDINDEAINLITFNQALTASSRFMTTVDECLETIINNMGMAGRG